MNELWDKGSNEAMSYVNQFDLYQRVVEEYRLPSANTSYLIMGLGAEAGEVLDKFAKLERDGYTVTEKDFKRSVAKELGDCLWFIALLAKDMGYKLSDIANMNAEKLASRKERNKLQGSGDER